MGLKTLCRVSDCAVAHWHKAWVKPGLAQLQVGTLKSASFLELTSSSWQGKMLSTGSTSYRKTKPRVNVIFKLEV